EAGHQRLLEGFKPFRVDRGGFDLAIDEIADGVAELELLRGQSEIMHTDFPVCAVDPGCAAVSCGSMRAARAIISSNRRARRVFYCSCALRDNAQIAAKR